MNSIEEFFNNLEKEINESMAQQEEEEFECDGDCESCEYHDKEDDEFECDGDCESCDYYDEEEDICGFCEDGAECGMYDEEGNRSSRELTPEQEQYEKTEILIPLLETIQMLAFHLKVGSVRLEDPKYKKVASAIKENMVETEETLNDAINIFMNYIDDTTYSDEFFFDEIEDELEDLDFEFYCDQAKKIYEQGQKITVEGSKVLNLKGAQALELLQKVCYSDDGISLVSIIPRMAFAYIQLCKMTKIAQMVHANGFGTWMRRAEALSFMPMISNGYLMQEACLVGLRNFFLVLHEQSNIAEERGSIEWSEILDHAGREAIAITQDVEDAADDLAVFLDDHEDLVRDLIRIEQEERDREEDDEDEDD